VQTRSAESAISGWDSETLTVGIEGMRCQNCAASIAGRLEALPGVREARISYALEDGRVRFHAEAVSAEQILREIEGAGYTIRRPQERSAARRDDSEAASLADRHRRLAVGIVASVLLMSLGMGVERLHGPDFPGRSWLMAALAGLVLIYVGREFHLGAWRAARSRTTNMDTLVSLGASVAFAYSFGVLLLGLDRTLFPLYFESTSMIVTLVMVGKVLEARGKREASGAVRALLAEQPERARVERDGEIYEVGADSIRLGDVVHVRPGERLPADGTVERGESHVDESMLSGESRPLPKRPGDAVHAGSINQRGAFAFIARAVGEATTLADIARLVREAEASRAPIQSTVDAISARFVPAMIALSIATGLFWGLFGGPRFLPELHPAAAGLLFAASTLLISCPCAMGLATPLALVAGSGVGAQRGLLFKSAAALETMGRIDSVVLDKTGTLTLGRPKVLDVAAAAGQEPGPVLALAAAVERESEHPLARALLAHLEELDLEIPRAEQTQATPGLGIRGQVEGREVAVGSRRYVEERGADASPLDRPAQVAAQRGLSSVFIALDGHAVAHLSIGDAPDPSARPALARLRALGLRVAMLTGDARAHALAIAHELGLEPEATITDVLPGEKADHVLERKVRGERVAMVGDGLNDAPALASADVGIAIGSGTDVAVEAADVVLVHDDLGAVADAIVLSRRTLRTIHQNLFWAFGYNVAAIPLAAGLFVPWGGDALRLSPGVAALAMALSSLFVVSNSARLRRFDPT
jgi:Cu+-exporting ATPase